MKPCLVCNARVRVDARHCPACGCADFGPADKPPVPPAAEPAPPAPDAPNNEPAPKAPDSETAESPAAEPAPPAPDNKPASRRR